MKKGSLVVAVIVASIFHVTVFSANPTAANAESDLQDQLQNIQQSAQQPNANNQSVNLPPPASPQNSNSYNLPPFVRNAANEVMSVVTPNSSNQKNEGEKIGINEQDLRESAFARMTTSALPLSPAQIEMLRNLYDATQRAAAVYPGVPPKPTSTSISVNLSPGSPPPVIRLGSGFVTSLVFVDSTGSPWPVDSYSLGNPNAFNIVWDKKSNILLIQAITAHKVANLAVLLKGLNTPVMIDLNPGQAAMDVRVDLRIPGLGPLAKPNFSRGLPGTENPFLLNLLDGVPPPGARALTSSGCDECVWLLNGKLFLRTQYTVLSPAWISTLSSADGTHVYELEPTPVILATYNGKTIKLRIEGF